MRLLLSKGRLIQLYDASLMMVVVHTALALRQVIRLRVRGDQRGLLTIALRALLVCNLMSTSFLRGHHNVCLAWMTMT